MVSVKKWTFKSPCIVNKSRGRHLLGFAIYSRPHKNPDIKLINQSYALRSEHLIRNDAPQYIAWVDTWKAYNWRINTSLNLRVVKEMILASSIYRRIVLPIIASIQYLVVAKKFGFGFGFMPEQNTQWFYASLAYTSKFPIETDFPWFFPFFGVS